MRGAILLLGVVMGVWLGGWIALINPMAPLIFSTCVAPFALYVYADARRHAHDQARGIFTFKGKRYYVGSGKKVLE